MQNEFFDYMKKHTVIKIDDIMNAMNEVLWLAPDYQLYIVSGREAVRKHGLLHIELMVGYKKSARRINGGCEVAIQYIPGDYEHGVIKSMKMNGRVYNAASKKI